MMSHVVTMFATDIHTLVPSCVSGAAVPSGFVLMLVDPEG